MITDTEHEGSFSVLIIGASRGIGAGFVEALAKRSDVNKVFCAARRPNDSAKLVSLIEQHPKRLVPIACDIADEASIEAMAASLARQTKHLHWIINTAGLLHAGSDLQPERRLKDVDPGNIQRSFAVNSIGPVLLAKHLTALMPRRDDCIFATLSARVGSISDNRLGGWYAYRAAKAAQNMLTKTLSIELKRTHRKIRVVALHPGTVDTDLSAPFNATNTKKRFSVGQSVTYLLKVLEQLDEQDNGKFFAWDGQEIAW
ncbi:MAG: SDR family NAD(P)-dependent oxidoreductase [Woeseiaceae bacterium]